MPETGRQWAAAMAIVFLYGMVLGLIQIAVGVDIPWWSNYLHFLGGTLVAHGFHWWNHRRPKPDPMDVAAWAAVTLGRPVIIEGNRIVVGEDSDD